MKIKVKAPPEGGRANKELLAFLARSLKVPRKELTLAQGQKAREKVIALPPEAAQRLNSLQITDIG